MRISDWSSDLCSSDLPFFCPIFLTVILACLRQAHGQNSLYPKLVGFRESLGIPRCRSVTIRLGQGDIICEMCDEMGATLAANSDLSPDAPEMRAIMQAEIGRAHV